MESLRKQCRDASAFLSPRIKKKQHVDKLTVTPAQVAAPVQLEALPVAVGGADGEPVAGQEVRSPRAALGQSLRLVQLLALRTLRTRGGHANIPCIPPPPPKNNRGGKRLRPSKLQLHNRDGPRSPRSLSTAGDGREKGDAGAAGSLLTSRNK